jgi:hypothetical protein
MNAHPHRYAGYRSRIPNAHIARALGDADDILREAVKADNRRRDAERICRASAPLHETRHYRIGEQTLLDLFAGIAFWFLVGIAPALCVLAIIAVAK